MSNTGYNKLISGTQTDFIKIFDTSRPGSITTGFKTSAPGYTANTDLGNIFTPYLLNPTTTGYKNSDGTDLGSLFAQIGSADKFTTTGPASVSNNVVVSFVTYNTAVTFTGGGSITFNLPPIGKVKTLLVAGGGGGGSGATNGQAQGPGGGGGAGGLGDGELTFLTNKTYSISIGSGGGPNGYGGDSVISGENISERAYGGGYGGNSVNLNGASGGSGGGANGVYPYTSTGGSATKGTGALTYWGGAGKGKSDGGTTQGGGGGGALGSPLLSLGNYGPGTPGGAYNWGVFQRDYYASGGWGGYIGSYTDTANVLSNKVYNGAGKPTGGNGGNATANTGSGGAGGASGNYSGGSGGSGICILAFNI
uniref:Glycine-rich domain-containing protein n=1 Tax=viral metagenome TaxID=1070528 RepID=A0A6C0HP72_9ZZZZ